MDWWCVLKSYQNLVAGLLGFFGVILTMLANAKIQRNVQKENINHEKNSLRVALKSELSSNQDSFEKRILFLNKMHDGKIIIQSKVNDDVYKKLLDKIGLLDAIEIEKIIKAYLLIEELPYKMKILVGTDGVVGIDNEFILFSGDRFEQVKELHNKFLPPIVSAIDELNKHLSQ